MTARETQWFLLSILASIALWGWFFGMTLALTLIAAVLIHEYGHYHWMGREGIQNKSMAMLPPFGAIAMAKEPFGTRYKEAKIALAGPAFGLISLAPPLALWFLTHKDFFLGASYLVCFINLFNLVAPVPILDGGRVVKSVLWSIHKSLAVGFYLVSLLILVIAPLFFPYLILALLPLFMTWTSFESEVLAGPRALGALKKLEAALNDIKIKRASSSNPVERDSLEMFETLILQERGFSDPNALARERDRLEALFSPPKMAKREMMLCISLYAAITLTYLAALYFLPRPTAPLPEYFKL